MPATPGGPPRLAAFFDVDGTLTRDTTLFAFLRHDLAARGRPAEEYGRARSRLRALTDAGTPRTETNRQYFELYAGRGEEELAAAGRAWFREARARPGFYRDEAVAALRAHAARGELIVLVSGSFAPCLDPIREELGADLLLCTRPQIAAGRYTGRTVEPMVDGAKARAVLRLATELGLSLGECHGYADHVSDVPFLEAVGRPVAVGDDPGLRSVARSRGWAVLQAAPTADPPEPSAVDVRGLFEAADADS